MVLRDVITNVARSVAVFILVAVAASELLENGVVRYLTSRRYTTCFSSLSSAVAAVLIAEASVIKLLIV